MPPPLAAARQRPVRRDVPRSPTDIDGLDKPVGSSCIYYGRKGELLAGYQFCFDVGTKKLESKSSF